MDRTITIGATEETLAQPIKPTNAITKQINRCFLWLPVRSAFQPTNKAAGMATILGIIANQPISRFVVFASDNDLMIVGTQNDSP